jgi:hypothetical protein
MQHINILEIHVPEGEMHIDTEKPERLEEGRIN